jgi:hypothetical protein
LLAKKPEGDVGLQKEARVIVHAHREQARSHKKAAIRTAVIPVYQ